MFSPIRGVRLAMRGDVQYIVVQLDPAIAGNETSHLRLAAMLAAAFPDSFGNGANDMRVEEGSLWLAVNNDPDSSVANYNELLELQEGRDPVLGFEPAGPWLLRVVLAHRIADIHVVLLEAVSGVVAVEVSGLPIYGGQVTTLFIPTLGSTGVEQADVEAGVRKAMTHRLYS